jgi:hypothetical protein
MTATPTSPADTRAMQNVRVGGMWHRFECEDRGIHLTSDGVEAFHPERMKLGRRCHRGHVKDDRSTR